MKHFALLFLAAASLLFTACEDKKNEAAATVTNTATETVQEETPSAMENAKQALADAAEATKKAASKAAEAAKVEADKIADAAADKAAEVKAAAEAKVAEAATAVKDGATAASEAVTETVTPENAAGKAAYAKCAGCHGVDGQTKALGKSNPLAGQTAQAIAEALHEYKSGTRNISGMGPLMKGQVVSMDDATIKAVAEYISEL